MHLEVWIAYMKEARMDARDEPNQTDPCLLENHIAGRCQHAGRCVTCGAEAVYDPHGRRYVHDDPAVSMAVDHAARVIRPREKKSR